jgi:hypothetical protein
MSIQQLLTQPAPSVELPYMVLPFKIPQNYGVQTYLAQVEYAIALDANDPEIVRTITIAGQNFNNRQLLLTLSPANAVFYDGFAPFGIDSWGVGVNPDEVDITFFNLNAFIVNTQVNILIFEVV